MDDQTEISSSLVADDKKSLSSNSKENEQKLKEETELLFEIQTICNMDTLMPHCELLNYKPKLLSTANFSKDNKNNILTKKCPADTNVTNLSFESETILTKTSDAKVISAVNDQTDMSNISYELMSGETDVNDLKNNLKESDTQKSDTDVKMIEEKEPSPKQVTHYKERDYDQTSDNSQICTIQQVDSNDKNTVDDIKRCSRRGSKRKKDFDGVCPICGVTLRLYDLESHYNQEVDKLSKISRCSKKPHLEETHRNEAFDLVKKNRENRLTARVAKYTARAKSEVKCPVCSLRMSGTAEEINKHVAFCIQDEDSEVDVDGEDEGAESFEEYEIGDVTRIRTISLVPGGYRSLHGDSVRQTPEDEDLNVDIDDTIAYGDPQYSEIDVIPNTTSEQDRMDLEELRKAVAIDPSVRQQNIECNKWSRNETEAETTELSKSTESPDPLVSSLKEKIKTLEDQDKSVRCLICLEPYTKPVVSTTCWHVHCEECWLMTMGVKKLCPQCNMIVFPSDLRKIYL